MHKTQAICIQHPESAPHSWGLRYLRRATGAPLRGIVVGPKPADRNHGTAYEFRFPEGTAHLRAAQALEYHGGFPFIPYGNEAASAPASAPALPLIPCPAWAVEESLVIGHINSQHDDPAILGVEADSAFHILCHRAGEAWRCLPPIAAAKLADAEPAVPPQDKRIPKEHPPWLVDAQVRCDAQSQCLLLLEWAWYRERIAHSYRWEGSFLTIHRASGHRVSTLGRLRARIRIQDNHGRHFRGHLRPRILNTSCFELMPVPPPANLWPDQELKPPPPNSPYALPPAGEYCVTPTGLCHRGGAGQDGSGLPGCPP